MGTWIESPDQEKKILIARWAGYAREEARKARSLKRDYRYLWDLSNAHYGRSQAFIHCARTLKGFETQAKCVNQRKLAA